MILEKGRIQGSCGQAKWAPSRFFINGLTWGPPINGRKIHGFHSGVYFTRMSMEWHGGGPTSNWDLQGPPWAPDVSTLTAPLGKWWLELGSTRRFFSFRSFEIAWLYFHAWSGGQAPWSCAVGKSSMSTDGCIQPFRSTLGFVPQSPPVSNAFLNGDSPPDFLYKDLGTIIQSKLQPIYKWMANKSGAGCLFIYIYMKMYNVVYFTYILEPFSFFDSRL